jgi:hypothetical protein
MPSRISVEGESLQVAVVNLSSKAGRTERIKADVLVQLQREPIRADGTVEGDEHLPLLGVADALDCPYQSRTLRHKELLVVVGVVVGREHYEDRTGQPAVNMVGDNTLQYCSLKHPIELALVGVEVVGGHRVVLPRRLRLLR